MTNAGASVNPIIDYLVQSRDAVQTAIDDAAFTGAIRDIAELAVKALRNGGKLLLAGNGGSAATASHFALDLAKNTIMPGAPRLKAISLTDHVPLITAWSNDTAYEHIFAEQLANLIEPGDVVLGISASGNSLNVINALRLAKQYRAYTVALLGAKGGKIKDMVDAYVLAPGQNIEQEEDAHMVLAHVITRHMRDVVRSYAQKIALAATN